MAERLISGIAVSTPNLIGMTDLVLNVINCAYHLVSSSSLWRPLMVSPLLYRYIRHKTIRSLDTFNSVQCIVRSARGYPVLAFLTHFQWGAYGNDCSSRCEFLSCIRMCVLFKALGKGADRPTGHRNLIDGCCGPAAILTVRDPCKAISTIT